MLHADRIFYGLTAALLLLPSFGASQDLYGAGSLDFSRINDESLVLDQPFHSNTISQIVFVLQAQGYEVFDHSIEDPFGGPSRYEYSSLACVFAYYIANWDERDVHLGDSRGNQQYVGMVLHQPNGVDLGISIPIYDYLGESFTLGATDEVVHGINGMTQTYNTTRYSSREGAEKDADNYCSISEVNHIELQEGLAEGALFRGETTPVPFSGISKVMLFR